MKKVGLVYFILAVGLFISYIFGLLSDVIDVDAAQYATISMEMIKSGDFFHVKERGLDYLDKPPLLFWISCLSYKLFGISSFTYKLPTFICSLLTLYFTKKLGEYLYDAKVGNIAAVILATSIGFVWINMDVKTDALLLFGFTFSMYHLCLYFGKNLIKHLIWGSIGIGVAMLAKGPAGIIFPVMCILPHLVLTKSYKKIFRLKHLLGLPVIVLVLLPMCIGLYEQFDMHPEKIVNGETNVSGLRFYFWEQSFGRITGENSWKNNMSFFFLFHSILMLFLPFSIIVVGCYWLKIKKWFTQGNIKEYYTLVGSIVILSSLSLSSYKIPHYSMVVASLVSILVASEVLHLINKANKAFKVHNIFLFSVALLAVSIAFYIFPFSVFSLIGSILLAAMVLFLFLKREPLKVIVATAILIAFVFNTHLIPNLQKYTAGKRFAGMIKEKGINEKDIFFLNRESKAIEFHLRKRIEKVTWQRLLDNVNQGRQAWYYMDENLRSTLGGHNLKVEDELQLLQLDMNRIKLEFLIPESRDENLAPMYLVKL